MFPRSFAPFFVACAALCTGCGASPLGDDDSEVASAASAIKGGYEDTVDTAVTLVVDVSIGGICSGVMK